MKVIPPRFVQRNAARALRYIDEGSNAMTRVGRFRATQLSSGKPIGKVTLTKMSQFARHKDNASYSGDSKNDNGAVAWLGWGNSLKNNRGVPDASNWAKRQLEETR